MRVVCSISRGFIIMEINPYLLALNNDVTSLISLTYPYTGAPPMSHGTSTKYTMETISRTVEYSRSSVEKDSGIFPVKRKKYCNSLMNKKDMIKPTGNVDISFLLGLADMLEERMGRGFFKACVAEAEADILKMHYSKLTEGRQTYDWTSERNMPAATALQLTVDAIQETEGTFKGTTMVEFCNKIMEMTDWKEVKFKKVRVIIQKTIDKKTKKEIKLKSPTLMISKIGQEEFLKRICTINTMTKDGERGRLKRRAIATPGMGIRPFSKIIETVAQKICEKLPESGLPVGGNEKKAKLKTTVTSTNSSMKEGQFMVNITGDNSKWNECQQPEAYLALMAFITRESSDFMKDVCSVAPVLFCNKFVKMGQGFRARNKRKTREILIPAGKMSENKGMMNEEWKKLFETIEKYMVGDCCFLGGGMLMGMFNMLSTVLGVMTLNYRDEWLWKKDSFWTGLQSSDDFVLFTVSKNWNDMEETIRRFIAVCKLIGINISLEKSYGCLPELFEFTSMFFSGDFVSNIALELPAFTTPGMNEGTDFTAAMSIIKTNMINNGLSPGTALMALRICLQEYRATYRVHPYDSGVKNHRMRIISKFIETIENKEGLLISDGGKLMNNLSNLHIPEEILKFDLMDHSYRNRVFNPKNPFTQFEKTVDIFKTSGPIRVEENDAVVSTHSFRTRTNRTLLNTDMKAMALEEKRYQVVCNMYRSVFESADVNPPIGSMSMGEAIELKILERAKVQFENGTIDREEFDQIRDEVEGAKRQRLSF
uniref:RNA-directed RNA polymerase catalytic subunit n=1 Tax=Ornate chorus frog influenza-like virus TaxID=2777033 RepID=A0A866W076_9ORTO|nr:polymerase basic 1 [Ornate chorus frog influenza-like virus]